MSISQISKEAGALSVGAVAICVGEVVGGAAITGIALVNLAVVWQDLTSQSSNRTRRAAETAVRAALDSSREFRDEDLATAAALLDTLPRDLTFEPGRTADLLGEDIFVTETAAEIVALLKPDPGTPAIGDILTFALEAGLAACANSDAFRDEMSWDVSLATLQTIVRVEKRMFDLADTILAWHEDLKASHEETLIQMARRIAMDVEDRDSALAELDRAVGIVQRLELEGHRPSNHPDFIDAVFARVAELNRANEMDTAAEELQAALERERDESNARQVKLLDGLIDQHTLRRDVDATVTAELQKLTLDGGGFEDLREVRRTWYERGRDKGLRFDLEVAIALARAEVDRAEEADTRGNGWNDLGSALTTLGERESGTARLEEGVTAFRLALEAWPRKRVPLDWATTQMNLGNALATLGYQESGTAQLEEAVAAYRLALEELTRARVPLDWARAQNNLGNALQSLGDRESGTARLEEAVAAYHLALEERTRERVPLGWARTQNNLGAALGTLGSRESGTGRLEEAIAAYRLALEEWTRARVPLDWAMTQMNLGNALTTLGERESGTARLEEAVAAYRLALEERTRERVPLDWARTQYNLALAEQAFADHPATRAPCPHLRRALAYITAALEVFDPETTAYDFEKARSLRDDLVARIAAQCADPAAG